MNDCCGQFRNIFGSVRSSKSSAAPLALRHSQAQQFPADHEQVHQRAPLISNGARLIRHVGRRAVTQIRQVQEDWLQWEAALAQHYQEN